MSEKKILREWYPLQAKAEVLKEAREKNGGIIRLSGVIQRANARNQNGRVYPKNVLEREAENYQKAIRERRALGELDHPAERATVNLAETSHLVTKVWWENDDLMGEIEVLPTPKGKILESLLLSNVLTGTSSRGLGTTRKRRVDGQEADEVAEDFQLICFDVVSEPSTHGAFLFKEGRSLDLDPKRVWSKADRIYRALNEITRK